MKYLHTMIRVNNLEESLRFYCDGLGLIQTSRTDYPKEKFSLIFLSAPADADVAKELDVPYQSPTIEITYNGPVERVSEEYSRGRNFGHLAFQVDDIFEKCSDLVQKGIVINRPPRDGYMAFIKSPDGISIELLQKGNKLNPVEPWKSMKNEGCW